MSLFSEEELGAAPALAAAGALALARKYRPKSFAELVGQPHVVRALTQALAGQRLHHAYLFTGTRGVGKTTISRIFAKALNCESGITATPCGVCTACREIDSGRFVDYIEMDAASNRGVEQMTQVLEQAVYKPTTGRFKVYMIDEVHMLSNHAFNAMLKTLEEPPEYVKFVLATTDPQKVPITVLSRCLQFNLKQMPRPEITEHLSHVLKAEQLEFDGAALSLIAQTASGSMRDALSLTDQAIAYSGGKLETAVVREMLGSVEEGYLYDLLGALSREDAQALLDTAAAMQARSIGLAAALDALATLLQRLAVLQVLPTTLDLQDPDAARLQELSQAFSGAQLQLFYSFALKGRQELPLAPDEGVGFTMVLLRMLSFAPASDGAPTRLLPRSAATRAEGNASPAAAPSSAPEPAPASAPSQSRQVAAIRPVALVSRTAEASAEVSAGFDGDWIGLCTRLARSGKLAGMPRELALQSELVGVERSAINLSFALKVPKATLLAAGSADKLAAVLGEAIGLTVVITTEQGAVENSAALKLTRERALAQAQAETTAEQDPLTRALGAEFGAKIVRGSVKILNQGDSTHV